MARPITHALVEALRSVPDFADLNDELLLEVVGASANLLWAAGETIFAPEDPAEAVFVILRGRVRIADEHDDVAELGEGDYFGEQALLLRTGHHRRAEAVEDCELMVIPRGQLEQLLDARPGLSQGFRETLERRIREHGPHE